MAETRVQVAYHFKIDPAQLVPGSIRLPEQIIRTVSSGEELFTEKVSNDALSRWDCAAVVEQLEKLCREATRTARPAGSPAPDAGAAAADDEISAF